MGSSRRHRRSEDLVASRCPRVPVMQPAFFGMAITWSPLRHSGRRAPQRWAAGQAQVSYGETVARVGVLGHNVRTIGSSTSCRFWYLLTRSRHPARHLSSGCVRVNRSGPARTRGNAQLLTYQRGRSFQWRRTESLGACRLDLLRLLHVEDPLLSLAARVLDGIPPTSRSDQGTVVRLIMLP